MLYIDNIQIKYCFLQSFLVDSSPVVTPRQPFHKRDFLSVEASNDTWRLLAYALIGVLCVLVVTVVVSLLVSWHCIRKRKAAMNRYYGMVKV